MKVRSNVTLRYLALALIALGISGCAAPLAQKSTASPQNFTEAVHAATGALMLQVKQQEGNAVLAGLTGKTILMLDPVVDANTAEVNKSSEAVETILREEAGKISDKFVFMPLTLENYDQAKYIVSGAFTYSSYTEVNTAKMYKLVMAVIDRKSGQVIASSQAWIAGKKIDITPVAAYQDSPMYLKDQRVEGQIETAQMSPGQQANPAYFNAMATSSLLVEADRAYQNGQIEQALSMYKAASIRPDGQLMKSYAGLYQTNRKLKRMSAAEIAFGQMVNIGYQNNNISTKLFFAVKSSDFISDAGLREQYDIWLRQIAKKFAQSKGCLLIVGHSSHSGSATYNEQLSLQRATAVQKLMQVNFPQIQQRSKPVGLGWKENIIGSGTDDMQDAIDRRVEFKLAECSAL
jgi:outer membrane protein OmpA-like peptidoglycan-associated protein